MPLHHAYQSLYDMIPDVYNYSPSHTLTYLLISATEPYNISYLPLGASW